MFTLESVFTHVASIYANVLEQNKAFALIMKKRVQIPQDWLFWATLNFFYSFLRRRYIFRSED